MMDMCGGWVSCSHQGFEGILSAVTDCRSSSLSYVMLAIFTGLVAEDQCQPSLALNAGVCCLPDNLMKGWDWNSHFENVNLCLFSNKSFFFIMTQDENILFCLGNDTDSLCFEISLISCQIWYTVKIETTIHFLCQGLIPFRENMNISHSSVSFHILNCLSVIGGERERERWSDPVPYFFAPLILPISFGLPAFSLSLSLRLAAEDNSFHNVWSFIPSSSVFLFMREQKMSSPVCLFISSIGRLMRRTALSQAFCDRLQSPCTGGLMSVCLRSSHRLAFIRVYTVVVDLGG